MEKVSFVVLAFALFYSCKNDSLELKTETP